MKYKELNGRKIRKERNGRKNMVRKEKQKGENEKEYCASGPLLKNATLLMNLRKSEDDKEKSNFFQVDVGTLGKALISLMLLFLFFVQLVDY